ncbi:unnamed protein product [Owenia fusiformis]|uniref:Methyltransferase domain-containing protein n=1 Tax=Owenia fusiformis TaxID=6347 RepID=A0A8S4NLG0_OWEFU|nr:unnamed protein product [Owenia fusiformis]
MQSRHALRIAITLLFLLIAIRLFWQVTCNREMGDAEVPNRNIIYEVRYVNQTMVTNRKLPIEKQTITKVINCITGGTIRNHKPSKFELFDATYKTKGEDHAKRQNDFVMIYSLRGWGGIDGTADLQASGIGSTLNYAQEAMTTLNSIVDQLKLTLKQDRISILDTACGDMQWMSRFLTIRTDVDYTGLDIVNDLIQHHKQTYKDHFNWSFFHKDIVKDPLDKSYDLVLLRMTLQHLRLHDIMQVLDNINHSGSKYLLSTTFPAVRNNEELTKDISTGRMRYINLELEPIRLQPPICFYRDGPMGDKENHYLGLWRIPMFQVNNCEKEETLMLDKKMISYYCASK